MSTATETVEGRRTVGTISSERQWPPAHSTSSSTSPPNPPWRMCEPEAALSGGERGQGAEKLTVMMLVMMLDWWTA